MKVNYKGRYIKGRKYEYKVCTQEREGGSDIVIRTAGSHSPIDVVSIDSENRVIRLIQCKAGEIRSSAELNKYERWKDKLKGVFEVEFVVL